MTEVHGVNFSGKTIRLKNRRVSLGRSEDNEFYELWFRKLENKKAVHTKVMLTNEAAGALTALLLQTWTPIETKQGDDDVEWRA